MCRWARKRWRSWLFTSVQSPSHRPITWAIALAGVMVFGIGFSSAAESPLAGTWKATVHFPPRSVSLWLIQIEDKDGKSAAKVLASSDVQLQDPKVKSIKAD